MLQLPRQLPVLLRNTCPALHKVIVEEDEKRDLIDREVIPHSYKGRAIGVVTARSVFREFRSAHRRRRQEGHGRRYWSHRRPATEATWRARSPTRTTGFRRTASPTTETNTLPGTARAPSRHCNLPAIPITNGQTSTAQETGPDNLGELAIRTRSRSQVGLASAVKIRL